MPTTPLSERWARSLRDHSGDVALTTPVGKITFAQLEALAQAEADRAKGSTQLARGSLLPLLTSILAALHRRVPAHLVERDRQQVPLAIPPPEGIALIKQTIGAAGIRRACFFTADQVLADIDRLHTALALPEHGAGIVAISCAHSYGLTVLALQLLCHGIPLHEVESPFPSHVSQALAAHPRTFLPAVPALWRHWIQSGIPLQNVTLALTAGAPLHPELAALRPLHDLYGTSETGAIALDNELLPGVTAETDPTTGNLTVHSDAVAQALDQPLPGELHVPGKTHTTTDRVTIRGNRLVSIEAQGGAANIAGRKVSPQEVLQLIRKALPAHQHSALSVQILNSRDPERHHELAAVLSEATRDELKNLRKSAAPYLAPWQTPRHWLSEPRQGVITVSV